MLPPAAPRATVFPYTTLFRSGGVWVLGGIYRRGHDRAPAAAVRVVWTNQGPASLSGRVFNQTDTRLNCLRIWAFTQEGDVRIPARFPGQPQEIRVEAAIYPDNDDHYPANDSCPDLPPR